MSRTLATDTNPDQGLELRRISICLDGRVLVDIDTVIRSGEIVTLMGPSGSGISSLLAHVCGMLPMDGNADNAHYHLIDQWLYLGQVNDADSAQQRLNKVADPPLYFDLDAYKIQLRFLLKLKPKQLTILPVATFAEEWS